MLEWLELERSDIIERQKKKKDTRRGLKRVKEDRLLEDVIQ